MTEEDPAPRFRRLHPDAAHTPLLSAEEVVAGLDLGARAPDGRPYVVVNMVATADGRATVAGRTGPISSPPDRALFHALRTRVDAVMVGAGTVRVERYGRLVKDAGRRERRRESGLSEDPLACIVSASLNLPADLPLLADPDSHVVVITTAAGELGACAARVEYLRPPPGEPVRLGEILARLREEHGVRSVLCEGGPHLNASLLPEGLVDELFLTTVPQLAGAAGRLSIVDDAPLEQPVSLRLLWLLESGGELFARYAVATPG